MSTEHKKNQTASEKIHIDQSYLQWPFFEDRHRTLTEKLAQWAEQHLEKTPSDHIDVDQACQKLVRKMGEDGWLNYAVSLKEEQQPLDVRTLCLIRETLSRYSSLADFAFAMQGLGSGAISLYGSDRLQKRYLKPVSQGEKIAAFALTEPHAGSDVAALRTHVTHQRDRFIINGEKTFISNGGIADFYVVFARSGPGTKNIHAFIVDADNPGLEISERIQVMAPHPLARITFNQCSIPCDHQLGQGGDGFKIAMATLDTFRPTVGAAALGFARRALHESLKHTRSRHLFGEPLSAMPIVQSQLADMALNIDASALLIYRAAWSKDCQGGRITREAAMAKLHATEQAQKIIDTAVQLFGGLGVTTGVTVEALYREIRALRIYEGASEVQKLIIARQLLTNKHE